MTVKVTFCHSLIALFETNISYRTSKIDTIIPMTRQTHEIFPIVGFDLDMTLVDTRRGIQASLEAMAEDMEIEKIDAEGIANRSGPPIQTELAKLFPEQPEKARRALEIFRKHMGKIGVQAVEAFPGAAHAITTVRELGGRSLVLTGKHRPLAIETLRQVELEVNGVTGDLTWKGKAAVLKQAGAWGYVGDHSTDVQAANLADVRAIGVASGQISAEELWEAGADNVLSTLEEFPELIRSSVQ